MEAPDFSRGSSARPLSRFSAGSLLLRFGYGLAKLRSLRFKLNVDSRFCVLSAGFPCLRLSPTAYCELPLFLYFPIWRTPRLSPPDSFIPAATGRESIAVATTSLAPGGGIISTIYIIDGARLISITARTENQHDRTAFLESLTLLQ